eukprot:scaffold2736_cov82-Skeletonema_dohrnii-CCMP3373.AAC.2
MLCVTDIRLFCQSEKEEKELGTSAVDDVNQSSSLYCAICIFVASWNKREYVHECICCVGATVLAMCKKEVRVDGRMNSMVDRAICLLYYNYLSACYMAIER